MAITVFNKENVDAVREAVTFALRSLPESHGLNCKCGHITYDKTTLTISVNVETLMHGFYMKELFKQNAVRMGLQPTDFGRTFRDKKHIYTITGYDQYGKYPIVMTREDGQTTKAKGLWVTERINN